MAGHKWEKESKPLKLGAVAIDVEVGKSDYLW